MLKTSSCAHSRRHALAFTLIEMLIVIAIIAVLAGLIAGVAIRSSASATRQSCMSNLHQIAAGLNIYVQGNNYRLPICTMTPSNPPVDELGMPGIVDTLLASCGGMTEIFCCPADTGRRYFLQEKTSYEWQSVLVNGRPMDPKSLKLLGVNRFIMMDYDNFHGGAGNSGKNFLYADGRALPEPELK